MERRMTLDVGGQTYTLALGINELIELEDLFSSADREVKYEEVLAKTAQGHLRYVRAVFWMALKKHHNLTLEAAGDLMNELESLDMSGHLTQLAQTATPDPADVKELGLDRPRKAQDGRRRGKKSGGVSISKPALPA